MVALPTTFVIKAVNSTAAILIVGELRLSFGDAFGQALESVELRAGMVHRGFTVVGNDGEGVIRADVDGRRVGRVLRVECVSEAIPSLFPEVGWLYADRMGDANPVGGLVVDEFDPAVVTVPLWIAVDVERDSFLMGEVVAVLQHVADAELQRALRFVPVERVEIIADETVKDQAGVTVTCTRFARC